MSSSPWPMPAVVPTEVPIPFMEEPVGQLDYDGHEVNVWAIACTPEGEVIFLNCCAADAAVSATLKRLLRKNTGKATFRPTEGISWSGPTQLSKLLMHYDTVTQALSYKGLRLKNQCIIPDCANIASGLSRPLETFLMKVGEHIGETDDGDEDETAESSLPEGVQTRSPSRYILGDIRAARPPVGTLFAHLKSLLVVAHPSWEPMLWQAATERGLLVAQPSLGIRAWSIPRDCKHWTDLISELWRNEQLPRPASTAPLSRSVWRKHQRTRTQQ